jgi:opacity protein-like surface antigen
MKKLIIIFIFCFPVIGYAEKGNFSDNSYYMIGINENTSDSKITGETNKNKNKNENGEFIILGNQINDFLGLELIYNNFGKKIISEGSVGDTFTLSTASFEYIINNAKLSADLTSLALGVRPSLNFFNNHISIFGKGGAHILKIKASEKISTVVFTEDEHPSISDTSVNIYYGFGLGFGYKNFTVNAAYSIYAIDHAWIDDVKSQSLSLGYKVNF